MTDGERWARAELEQLRAAGWRPAAVAAFLSESLRRAEERRAQRPALVRQARAWSALGALAWVAPGALGVKRFQRAQRAGLAWWGLTALMLDWHLGMFETEQGEPRPLGAADACTLARCWLVPLAAERLGPLVCGVALASDVLDGALARRSSPTRAGRDLEGLVDGVFAVAALRGALRGGGLARWAATLEGGRLLVGAGVACDAYFGQARPPARGLAHAARPSGPLRAAGLLAASLGHRRPAGALLAAGALAGAGAALGSARRNTSD